MLFHQLLPILQILLFCGTVAFFFYLLTGEQAESQ